MTNKKQYKLIKSSFGSFGALETNSLPPLGKTFSKHLTFEYGAILTKSFSNSSRTDDNSSMNTSFVGGVLSKLRLQTNKTGYLNNTNTQLDIENFIFSEFQDNKLTQSTIIGNVDRKLLGGDLYDYLESKDNELDQYINYLSKSTRNVKGEEKELMDLVIKTVGKTYINHVLKHQFLTILSFRESDYDDYINLLTITIGLGRKLINKFNFKLVINEKASSEEKLQYADILEKWRRNNPTKAVILKDDTFIAKLGGKMVDILEASGMLKRVLNVESRTERHYVLDVDDSKLLNKLGKRKVFIVPSKLPMIVKPKEYSDKELGGYLLNNEKYIENIFIEKKAYGVSSELKRSNQVYSMVNNISKTAFKVNKDLLSFITGKLGSRFLLDSKLNHKYELLEKTTKLQEKQLKAHKSKLLQQEIILDIAEFYKDFREIYFPVRLDQRGRLYCTPNFFNYQSNELSKSLLLFSEPGIMNRIDQDCILYLKAYGVNCYAGSLSKRSIDFKCKWVDKYEDKIVNYEENLDFIEKAKDKLLFLSFCMEYKRYIDFKGDERLSIFETFLPIQLDATCNGFQHMAMLSDEEVLFDELNLKLLNSSQKKSEPVNEAKDFYSFILHKLLQKFKSKLDEGIEIDEVNGGSYKNLNEFVWDRKYIKKTIMTIPYNASIRSMQRYFLGELHLKYEKDGVQWFSDRASSQEVINNRDASLLVKSIVDIIMNDYEKIKKLTLYLINIAKLFDSMNMPITWNLPSGLTINQSYLQTKTITLKPFAYSKTKLNLKTTIKDKYDHNKQIRALMPNLIHSLDGNSMCKLYYFFRKGYKNQAQFFSIHDCFATTCEKVSRLKHILASIYTDLYSRDDYLKTFDNDITNLIRNMTGFPIENTVVTLYNGEKYIMHDIDWVINKRIIPGSDIRKIDSQYILI